jgi:hypothetical protein
MAEQVSKSDFLSQFQRQTDGAWDEARKAEDSFAETDLPEDVKFNAKLTSLRYGIDKNDDPYFALNAVIVSPAEYKTQRPSKFYSLKSTSGATTADRLEWFVKDMKRLGVDTDEMTDAQLVEACEQLTKDKPVFRMHVTKDEQYGDKVWINGLVRGEAGGADNPQPEASNESDTPSTMDYADLAADGDGEDVPF